MNGILVVDKPSGRTSFSVVAEVKRRLKAKKVGHLGTLDPMATGVLPFVIDGATRYADLFEKGRKEYSAVMRLGLSTDTYDITGAVLTEADASAVTQDEVRSAILSHVGRIQQIPPMFSAVKQGGVPLYKLARKGVTVERAAREVEVFSIEIGAISLPDVAFVVQCSKGTYVRSICHDTGATLGCGAVMVSLERTMSGGFTKSDAVSLLVTDDELAAGVIPLELALRRATPEEATGKAAVNR